MSFIHSNWKARSKEKRKLHRKSYALKRIQERIERKSDLEFGKKNLYGINDPTPFFAWSELLNCDLKKEENKK